jgi:hypothetical protein
MRVLALSYPPAYILQCDSGQVATATRCGEMAGLFLWGGETSNITELPSGCSWF